MWKNPRFLLLVAVACLALALLAFYYGTGTTVSIDDAGQRRTLTTHAATVGSVLHESGIEIFPADTVRPPLTSPVRDGLAITLERSFEIQVQADGRTLSQRAQGDSVAAILANLQIALGPQDDVLADNSPLSPEELAQPFLRPPRQIVVRRSIPFTVVEGDQSRALTSTASTVGEALAQNGVTLHHTDRVAPPPDARLTPGLTVTLLRSQLISVQVDGSVLTTRVPADSRTVGQALAEAGVALVGLDYTAPASDQRVPADGVIVVKRVVERLISESVPVPFKTTYQARPDLEIDNTVVVQNGQGGVAQRRLRVRYENGVELTRKNEGQWVSLAPKDQIIGYGTNIVIRALDTPDGPIQYWRKIFVRVTSYSPARSGTPRTAPWYGRTRTGKILTKGMVAVDPKAIPLHTPIYVIGYGVGSAEDTGGSIKGKWIDLGYDDDNYKTWHGYTDIYLLAPAPPPDQIVWILP